MELSRVRFVARAEVFAERPARLASLRLEGLWVRGTIAGLRQPTVAVVGSRAPSEAGRARAHGLGEALARAGVCVLSGLALGIDGAAHAGALAGGGCTIGILGGGHDRFFPSRNRPLAEAMIATGGGVVSPYPPEEPARPWQFLQRNGLVAALADAVVVVEAARRSGALNTASWAAALGVDVLAFPGDVERPKAAGCNALIRDGATLVRDPSDVLADLGLGAAQARDAGRALPLATEPLEAAILDRLAAGPHGVEALLERTGGALPELTAALMRLELAGVLEHRPDTLEFALRQR